MRRLVALLVFCVPLVMLGCSGGDSNKKSGEASGTPIAPSANPGKGGVPPPLPPPPPPPP